MFVPLTHSFLGQEGASLGVAVDCVRILEAEPKKREPFRYPWGKEKQKGLCLLCMGESPGFVYVSLHGCIAIIPYYGHE